jgi:hypothetical protein
MRGGAMRISTSLAAALKTNPPAKTNPINRFRTIILLSILLLRLLATHVCGRTYFALRHTATPLRQAIPAR